MDTHIKGHLADAKHAALMHTLIVHATAAKPASVKFDASVTEPVYIEYREMPDIGGTGDVTHDLLAADGTEEFADEALTVDDWSTMGRNTPGIFVFHSTVSSYILLRFSGKGNNIEF